MFFIVCHVELYCVLHCVSCGAPLCSSLSVMWSYTVFFIVCHVELHCVLHGLSCGIGLFAMAFVTGSGVIKSICTHEEGTGLFFVFKGV